MDTYGGYSPHGGGAFSGKDPTKVDRSAAYMMRYIAKNIVASGQAPWATCQVSYAIGLKDPMSFYIETPDSKLSRYLTEWVNKNVDLTPKGIIDKFKLFTIGSALACVMIVIYTNLGPVSIWLVTFINIILFILLGTVILTVLGVTDMYVFNNLVLGLKFKIPRLDHSFKVSL